MVEPLQDLQPFQFNNDDIQRFERIGMDVQSLVDDGFTPEEISQAATHIESRDSGEFESQQSLPITPIPNQVPEQPRPSFWGGDEGAAGVGDLALQIKSGVQRVASNVVGFGLERLGKTLGSENLEVVGQILKEELRGYSEAAMEAQSPENRIAASRQYLDRDAEGNIIRGDATFATVQNTIASAVGSTLPSLYGGSVAARTLRKAGASPVLAGALGFAGAGATAEGLGTASDIFDDVKATPDDIILNSPLFKQYESIIVTQFPQASLEDKIDFVRDQVAEYAMLDGGLKAGGIIGVTSLPFGGLLGQLGFRGKHLKAVLKKGIGSAIFKGASFEGFQEGSQEFSQQVIQNYGNYLAGRKVMPTAGAGEAAVTGFIGGAPIGGTVAGGTQFVRNLEQDAIDETLGQEIFFEGEPLPKGFIGPPQEGQIRVEDEEGAEDELGKDVTDKPDKVDREGAPTEDVAGAVTTEDVQDALGIPITTDDIQAGLTTKAQKAEQVAVEEKIKTADKEVKARRKKAEKQAKIVTRKEVDKLYQMPLDELAKKAKAEGIPQAEIDKIMGRDSSELSKRAALANKIADRYNIKETDNIIAKEEKKAKAKPKDKTDPLQKDVDEGIISPLKETEKQKNVRLEKEYLERYPDQEPIERLEFGKEEEFKAQGPLASLVLRYKTPKELEDQVRISREQLIQMAADEGLEPTAKDKKTKRDMAAFMWQAGRDRVRITLVDEENEAAKLAFIHLKADGNLEKPLTDNDIMRAVKVLRGGLGEGHPQNQERLINVLHDIREKIGALEGQSKLSEKEQARLDNFRRQRAEIENSDFLQMAGVDKSTILREMNKANKTLFTKLISGGPGALHFLLSHPATRAKTQKFLEEEHKRAGGPDIPEEGSGRPITVADTTAGEEERLATPFPEEQVEGEGFVVPSIRLDKRIDTQRGMDDVTDLDDLDLFEGIGPIQPGTVRYLRLDEDKITMTEFQEALRIKTDLEDKVTDTRQKAANSWNEKLQLDMDRAENTLDAYLKAVRDKVDNPNSRAIFSSQGINFPKEGQTALVPLRYEITDQTSLSMVKELLEKQAAQLMRRSLEKQYARIRNATHRFNIIAERLGIDTKQYKPTLTKDETLKGAMGKSQLVSNSKAEFTNKMNDLYVGDQYVGVTGRALLNGTVDEEFDDLVNNAVQGTTQDYTAEELRGVAAQLEFDIAERVARLGGKEISNFDDIASRGTSADAGLRRSNRLSEDVQKLSRKGIVEKPIKPKLAGRLKDDPDYLKELDEYNEQLPKYQQYKSDLKRYMELTTEVPPADIEGPKDKEGRGFLLQTPRLDRIEELVRKGAGQEGARDLAKEGAPFRAGRPSRGLTKEEEAELKSLTVKKKRDLTRAERSELQRILVRLGRDKNEQAELEHLMLNNKFTDDIEFPSGPRSSDTKRDIENRLASLRDREGGSRGFTKAGIPISPILEQGPADKTKVKVSPAAMPKHESRKSHRLVPKTQQEIDEAGRIDTTLELDYPMPDQKFIGPTQPFIGPVGTRVRAETLAEKEARGRGTLSSRMAKESKTRKDRLQAHEVGEVLHARVTLEYQHVGNTDFIVFKADVGGHEGDTLGWVEINGHLPKEWEFNAELFEKLGLDIDDAHIMIGNAVGQNLLHKASQGFAINFKYANKRIKAHLEGEQLAGYNDVSALSDYDATHEENWAKNKKAIAEEEAIAEQKVRDTRRRSDKLRKLLNSPEKRRKKQEKKKKEEGEPFKVEMGDELVIKGTGTVPEQDIDEINKKPPVEEDMNAHLIAFYTAEQAADDVDYEKSISDDNDSWGVDNPPPAEYTENEDGAVVMDSTEEETIAGDDVDYESLEDNDENTKFCELKNITYPDIPPLGKLL